MTNRCRRNKWKSVAGPTDVVAAATADSASLHVAAVAVDNSASLHLAERENRRLHGSSSN